MELNKFTKENIEELLAIQEFQKSQERLYKENFIHPLINSGENKTYEQVENEKLWNKIRNKKK